MDDSGHSSFEKVVESVKILRQYGIEPGILQTLTRDNIPQVVENFRFFVDDLNIKSLAINPYRNVGSNKEMRNQGLTDKEFTTVLKVYIDLWLTRNDENLRVREIDNFLGGILRKPVHSCEFNGLCWTVFCLNYDGKIYLCDRFLGQEEFFCGDFSKQSLLEIFNSDIWQDMVRRVNILPSECRACEWQSVCCNGCSHLRVGGIGGKYYYCQTRKKVFAYLKEKLQNLHEKT
jgi:uncharacterized protein